MIVPRVDGGTGCMSARRFGVQSLAGLEQTSAHRDRRSREKETLQTQHGRTSISEDGIQA